MQLYLNFQKSLGANNDFVHAIELGIDFLLVDC